MLIASACDDQTPRALTDATIVSVDSAVVIDSAVIDSPVAVDAAVVPEIPPIGTASTQVTTRAIATGFIAPLLGVAAPGVADMLFVVDQVGIIWLVDLTTGAKSIFLDVRPMIVPLGIASLSGYDERGLLGLAFDPSFQTTGLLYTFTSEPVGSPTDFTFRALGADCPTRPATLAPDHQNVLREWHVTPARVTSTSPDPQSRVVIRIDWPGFNNNGGMLAFGPDKMLYMSLGDGGGEDDQTCQIGLDGKPTIGHSSQGNAQDPAVAYGKIFRIDPRGRTSANRQYSVPPDNPLVGKVGMLPEIFALGLRNLWRFSFDSRTGALIGGDVGQNTIEEIDVIRSGGNYGWRIKEGTGIFTPAGFAFVNGQSDGHVTRLAPGEPAGVTDPIAQYRHTQNRVQQGRAVIGGYVYRGSAIPSLVGRYIFGDYTQAKGMTAAGRLLALDQMPESDLTAFANGTATPQGQEKVDSLIGAPLAIFTLGFAVDTGGEIYVLGNRTGTPQGSSGELRMLVQQ